MSPTQRKQILIIDDTEQIALLSGHILKSAGYETQTASDGPSGLDRMALTHPDLVLLDLILPGMHGLDVLKAIKSNPKTKDIHVIVCTSKDFQSDRNNAIELGAAGFLTKPLSRDVLLETVASVLSGKLTLHLPLRAVTEVPEILGPPPSEIKYIKLWGTRGSTPVSGKQYTQHGGNTPTMEIRTDTAVLIIDAGTGIRELGASLMREPIVPIYLFIGHTHWDHIQGFPFFQPAYRPGQSLTMYGATAMGKNLESVFRGQFASDYFPVQLQEMMSTRHFKSLDENPIKIGAVNIAWQYVHHPGAAVGFRFNVAGKSVCYITDNEFLKGYLGSPMGLQQSDEILLSYSLMIDFVRDADILITEAQYPDDEYEVKVGWGHTRLSNACLLCKLGNVKRWVVTHHDPAHDDAFLNRKLEATKKILSSLGCNIPVSHAFDGMVVELGP
jgi:CheY-like chemotaxis protein/phosphoribosyl 1,2-cyclic phosphodiesterase